VAENGGLWGTVFGTLPLHPPPQRDQFWLYELCPPLSPPRPVQSLLTSLFSQLLFGEVIILSLIVTNTTATFVRRSQDVHSHRGCGFKLPRHPMVDCRKWSRKQIYASKFWGNREQQGIIDHSTSKLVPHPQLLFALGLPTILNWLPINSVYNRRSLLPECRQKYAQLLT
jgi:hypothetical protein